MLCFGQHQGQFPDPRFRHDQQYFSPVAFGVQSLQLMCRSRAFRVRCLLWCAIAGQITTLQLPAIDAHWGRTAVCSPREAGALDHGCRMLSRRS